MLNKHRYAVEILEEENITLQQQNQIHKILNIAYDGISVKFLKHFNLNWDSFQSNFEDNSTW